MTPSVVAPLAPATPRALPDVDRIGPGGFNPVPAVTADSPTAVPTPTALPAPDDIGAGNVVDVLAVTAVPGQADDPAVTATGVPRPTVTATSAPAPAAAAGPIATTTTMVTPQAPTAVPTAVVVNKAGAPTVYLDPGHGGIDTGTIGTTDDGTSVDEKDMALALAQRTANVLRADGINVVLSRTTDSLPGIQPSDYTSDGSSLTPDGVLDDLQRRIDRANTSGAQVYFSIHLNSFDDPSIGGTETFYDGSRPFADKSLRFASMIQDSVISALRAGGYTTPDRGIMDDEDLQTESLGSLTGNYNHLVVLGPAIPNVLRATNMPGALIETLFLSNPPEASAIVQPAMQDLIANAFAKAIEDYLKSGN